MDGQRVPLYKFILRCQTKRLLALKLHRKRNHVNSASLYHSGQVIVCYLLWASIFSGTPWYCCKILRDNQQHCQRASYNEMTRFISSDLHAALFFPTPCLVSFILRTDLSFFLYSLFPFPLFLHGRDLSPFNGTQVSMDTKESGKHADGALPRPRKQEIQSQSR